jgi:hypothetical protein
MFVETMVRCEENLTNRPIGVIMHPSTYSTYLAQIIYYPTLPQTEIVPGIKIHISKDVEPGTLFFIYPYEA